MGHEIRAVIGLPEVVQAVVRGAGCPDLTMLPQGLAIAALGHNQVDALTKLKPGQYADHFTHLSDGIKIGIFSLIGNACIAYIETSYFGGTGSQGAAVFCDGEVAYEHATSADGPPTHGSGPINGALRRLGVQVVVGDEFDTLGLHRFRSLEALGLTDDEE